MGYLPFFIYLVLQFGIVYYDRFLSCFSGANLHSFVAITIEGKEAVLTYYVSYHKDNRHIEPFLNWIRVNYRDIML